MAIYYCKECAFSQEVKKEYSGKRANCPKCNNSIKIYDTVIFVDNLIKKYKFQAKELSISKENLKGLEEILKQNQYELKNYEIELLNLKQSIYDKDSRELEELQKIEKQHQDELKKQEIKLSKLELENQKKLKEKIKNQTNTLNSLQKNLKKFKDENNRLTKEIENNLKGIAKSKISNSQNIRVVKKSQDNINVNKTKEFTKKNQYISIINWFKEKNIQTDIDVSNIDTTGFFDEIAEYLGENYKILKPLIDKIRYIQNHDYSHIKFDISNKTPNDIRVITSFCNQLYKYSFISRYYYDKKLKIVRLNLQQVPKIKAFFNGIWMEWFILIKVLKLFKEFKIDASIMRSIKIIKSNEQENELDIFILTKDNRPIYIECKTGEFREDINKYLRLQKILSISKEDFIICILDLDNSFLDGLTSMYELKFINENYLIKYLEDILV